MDFRDIMNRVGGAESLPQLRPLDLPVIGETEAAMLLQVLTPRGRAEFATGLSIAPTGVDLGDVKSPVAVVLSIGGRQVELIVPRSILRGLIESVAPGIALQRLDAATAGMLVEAFAQDEIDALAAALNLSVTVERIEKPSAAPQYAIPLAILREGDPVAEPGRLCGSRALLSRLAAHWSMRPLVPQFELPKHMVAARVALTVLPTSSLRALSVGDALLFDRVGVSGGAVAILGERLAAQLQFDDQANLRFVTNFAGDDIHEMTEFAMTDTQETGAAVVDDADLDDLPVKLVFELGRAELSVAELKELAVGAPLPIPGANTSRVDILANGRRLGAGELVMIGDQLGLRITRLGTNA